ncbi:MAG: MBOAT family protein [Lachnospiraceae bacterium]|nr:MBOAT family protein [Lachnospiraceae bacterium]
MLFNSLDFLIFLPAAFCIYWASPVKIRAYVLLALSYYFYFNLSGAFTLILICVTALTWGASFLISGAESPKLKKGILAAALCLSLSFLLFFKYFNFFSEAIADALNFTGMKVQPLTLALFLPAGISFYTFQAVGYLIDVAKGKIPPEKNPAIYALFVSFFPQVLSGPIGRADSLLPQLKSHKALDTEGASYGLRLMLLGFFKKLIVADALGRYVDIIFQDVYSYFGLTFIAAAIMYTFQIYCDFSGYSEIALGTARLFNIELMTNFRSPYCSRSIREFWSRWHISLSTWFRDYVYIPLGGSRVAVWRTNLNLLITFLVSGLWHGASWTFIFWGGLHGIFQITENAIGRIRGPEKQRDKKEEKWNLIGVAKWLLTLVLVSIAWIFFRANSLPDALYVVTHLHNGVVLHFANAWKKMMVDMTLTPFGIVKLLTALVAIMVYDFFSLKRDLLKKLGTLKLPIRWAVYTAFTVLIIVVRLHNAGGRQTFIYFNF